MRPTVTTRKLIVSDIYKTYIKPGTKGVILTSAKENYIVQFEGCPGLYRVPFGSDLVKVDGETRDRRNGLLSSVRRLFGRLRLRAVPGVK